MDFSGGYEAKKFLYCPKLTTRMNRCSPTAALPKEFSLKKKVFNNKEITAIGVIETLGIS